MKIVDVAESYSPHGGGVRTYIHQKLEAAREHGHTVVVVAPGTQDSEERVPGGRIVWVAGPRSPVDGRYGFFRDESAVHSILDREQPDVVEGSSPWAGGRFVASWRGAARKSLIFHTDPVAVWPQTFLGRHVGFDRVDRLCRPWWTRLARLCRSYDTTVVSGAWLGRRLREFGITNSTVVPFGIDKERFSPMNRSDSMRRRLLAACGVPEHGKLLIVVSRLDPEKRIATLIEAFERAARHRAMGLVLFGRGALQGWYARKAARTEGVHLHGYVSDQATVATAVASADAFLHGSAAETYGLVVAEAICSGTPVIVPDRGGAAALAGPGYAATYQAGDPRSCSEAILSLLERDARSSSASCRVASRHIATTDQHFTQLFALYASMLTRRECDTKVPSLRVAS